MAVGFDVALEPGVRKAAVFVAGLDARAADRLFDRLDAASARIVRDALAELDGFDPDEWQNVADEFHRFGAMRPGRAQPGIELDALSVDHREWAPSEDDSSRPVGFLHQTEEEELADLLQGERPQTIAAVLLHLPSERAGNVLARFTPAQQVEIVRRLADLDQSEPETLREVERALEDKWSQRFSESGARSAGPEAVSRILATCDRQIASDIINRLKEHDRLLAEQLIGGPAEIDAAMDYETLADLDEAVLTALFRAAPPDVARVALLGSSPKMVDRLLAALESEEADSLRRGLLNPGPIRLSDVEEARRQMTDLARQMLRRK